MPVTVTTPDRLDPADVAGVRHLVRAFGEHDGRDPLSDQALSGLASDGVRHAVAHDGGRIVGYAQRAGESIEIAADDTAASALLDALDEPPGALIWTHGEHSPLVAVLEHRGFARTRELFQLRRGLERVPDVPAPPEGIEIRPFAVGRDEDDWLRVNAAAFADHPEQGSWTIDDLRAREAEEWFDPDGFLLAWKGNRLAGFHWTKIHPGGAGEVYVIGVDPSGQGLGLGKILLAHGLASLYERGCRTVLLYVDGSNTTAMRLYEKDGFTRHDLDVQWADPAA